MPPKISFVIPAYNEEKFIGPCIDSILDEMRGKNTEYEILVVNNASSDGTKNVALEHGARVVDEPRKGLTKARQCGLQNARGEWLAHIDADCRLSKTWFENLQKLQKKYPHAVCISGPYHYYDAPFFSKVMLTIMWNFFAPITYRLVGYMALGGNFTAKKEALLATGGFDENIDFYGEDTNIARRLSKVGDVIFSMKFFVLSSARRFASQGLIKINVIYGVNFVWEVLFKKPFNKKS